VAALISSELITNSVLETAKYEWAVPPPVRLWLRGGPPGIAILEDYSGFLGTHWSAW
jgi:hypothetical protein